MLLPIGRHTVEILHNGEAIMGSPFYVEIYDPNKIRVEGSRTGEVGGKMEFDGKIVTCPAFFSCILISIIMLLFLTLPFLTEHTILEVALLCEI